MILLRKPDNYTVSQQAANQNIIPLKGNKLLYTKKKKIMNLFYFKDPEEVKTDQADKQINITHIESTDYTAEGSEFLDDAIRIKEQPFKYSPAEESIVPGSPQD